eukprot:17590-Pelagococcus_subviridis.AAC.16
MYSRELAAHPTSTTKLAKTYRKRGCLVAFVSSDLPRDTHGRASRAAPCSNSRRRAAAAAAGDAALSDGDDRVSKQRRPDEQPERDPSLGDEPLPHDLLVRGRGADENAPEATRDHQRARPRDRHRRGDEPVVDHRGHAQPTPDAREEHEVVYRHQPADRELERVAFALARVVPSIRRRRPREHANQQRLEPARRARRVQPARDDEDVRRAQDARQRRALTRGFERRAEQPDAGEDAARRGRGDDGERPHQRERRTRRASPQAARGAIGGGVGDVVGVEREPGQRDGLHVQRERDDDEDVLHDGDRHDVRAERAFASHLVQHRDRGRGRSRDRERARE